MIKGLEHLIKQYFSSVPVVKKNAKYRPDILSERYIGQQDQQEQGEWCPLAPLESCWAGLSLHSSVFSTGDKSIFFTKKICSLLKMLNIKTYLILDV